MDLPIPTTTNHPLLHRRCWAATALDDTPPSHSNPALPPTLNPTPHSLQLSAPQALLGCHRAWLRATRVLDPFSSALGLDTLAASLGPQGGPGAAAAAGAAGEGPGEGPGAGDRPAGPEEPQGLVTDDEMSDEGMWEDVSGRAGCMWCGTDVCLGMVHSCGQLACPREMPVGTKQGFAHASHPHAPPTQPTSHPPPPLAAHAQRNVHAWRHPSHGPGRQRHGRCGRPRGERGRGRRAGCGRRCRGSAHG